MLSITPILDSARLLNILLTGCLVLLDKVVVSISAEPICHLAELFTETVDRLRVHVRLGNQLWE